MDPQQVAAPGPCTSEPDLFVRRLSGARLVAGRVSTAMAFASSARIGLSSRGAAGSVVNDPLVLGEFQRSRLGRPESPDLRPVRPVPARDIREVDEQQAGGSDRIVANPATCDYGEAGPLDDAEDLRPEHHVVVARDKAIHPSPRQLRDEFVILIGPEQAGVELRQWHDLDRQYVFVDRLAKYRLREVLVQRRRRAVRRRHGGFVGADPRARWPPRGSGASASDTDR